VHDSVAPDDKAVFTRRVLEVLNGWRVEPLEQTRLLGLPEKDAGRRFRRYRLGTTLPDDREVWIRVALLLHIDSAANQLFPHSALSANLWITTPSPRFAGKTPLELMLSQGLEGIRWVERTLTSQEPF
jgi:hypothetical protein